jgi:hypothetical protein
MGLALRSDTPKTREPYSILRDAWLGQRPRESRTSFKTVGDCPDFAQSSEQNGTVPFSERVLKLLLVVRHARIEGATGGSSTRVHRALLDKPAVAPPSFYG